MVGESATLSQGSGDGTGRPRIALLPGHVVDQIAAGEVVERPASVVKELVENALDAGATHVTVEAENGGKTLIRVLDNGCGMTEADARLALQRHATSKLTAFEDLFSLRTMGFRGEALPSIAAVSRMSLTTRTADQVAAAVFEIEGGRIASCSEAGAPVGTRIEVRDLLFNVPARLKFLKGHATESSHITDTVTKLALAHPDVHVRLKHGGRTAIDAPRHADAFERARVVLGTRNGRRLHRVDGEEGGVRVRAFLAAPELAQTTSRCVQMFVGRRAVRDRGLLHALGMGYGELVPRGRYPVAVLFVDAPSGAVDINVHPQKLEVRFSDPQRVYAAVRHTVGSGVGRAPWLADRAVRGVSPVRMHAIASTAPPVARGRASEVAASYARERSKMLLPWRRPRVDTEARFPMGPPATDDDDGGGELEARAVAAPSPEVAGTAVEPEREAAAGFFAGLRYCGQLDRTYLLCEAEGELVLIDQHAAHERVEFQRLRQRYQERTIPVQRLLFPHTMELAGEPAQVARESIEALAAVGFELDSRGGGTFALRAVPAGLRGADGATVLAQLLDELVDGGGSRAVDERLDAVFATIACHSVVRAGDVLSPREVEALLCSLDGVDFRAHCPHGRPVLLRISVSEIARRFGR